MIKVSIILPNYNHGKYLNKRIYTILNQTYQNFELILLDDQSTDNSLELLRQYEHHPKVAGLYINAQNSGSTFKQWEKGINLAKGEYIWIAESDDYCEYNLLDTLVTILESDASISLAYCKSVRVDENGARIDDLGFWYDDLHPDKWHKDYINEGADEIKNYLAYRNTIPNASAVVFRKSAFKTIKRVPKNYKLSGDWLFWIKMIEQNKVAYSVATTNYFRTHQRTVRHEKNHLLFTEKIKVLKYLKTKSLLTRQFKATQYPQLSKEISRLIRKEVLIQPLKLLSLFLLFEEVFAIDKSLAFNIIKRKLLKSS